MSDQQQWNDLKRAKHRAKGDRHGWSSGKIEVMKRADNSAA
jgi:hypothetical protein